MELLDRHDLRLCMQACPWKDKSPDGCSGVCARASIVNSRERGKLFNVPFRAPPIEDLDTGTTDEMAWAAMGQVAFGRSPWQAARQADLSLAQVGPPQLASMMRQQPPEWPSMDSLPGAFYGWQRVPDGLWRQTFVPSTEEVFERVTDANQALSGYLVDPTVFRAPDGPLSNLKPTMGNSAGQLPQMEPFAGVGFNLSQNTPRGSVANVFGLPTLFERSVNSGSRSMRLANLSA